MSRRPCKQCRHAAICLASGFYAVYNREFQKRFADTHRVLKVPQDTAHPDWRRLRSALDSTAMQAARAFPRRCPGNPYAVHPMFEEFRMPSFMQRGSATVRIGGHMVEVEFGGVVCTEFARPARLVRSVCPWG